MNNIELKAAAFDLLMSIMEGRHRYVTSVRRIVPIDVDFNEVFPSNPNASGYEDVPIYEWSIRNPGSSDIRQSLLDQAEKGMK